MCEELGKTTFEERKRREREKGIEREKGRREENLEKVPEQSRRPVNFEMHPCGVDRYM